jgi:hypothetical protein
MLSISPSRSGALTVPERSEARFVSLGTVLEEPARAVWLARNWSVDEMLDAWERCMARKLASDGEPVDLR